MRPPLSKAPLLLLLASAAPAVIIDRVAVSVGNSVITESQIDLTIRITAFLNGEPPDVRPQSRRQTADRLVDQLLVRNELQMSRYPAPPREASERLLNTLRKDRFHANDAELQAALARYQLILDDLRSQFVWTVTFLRFVEARFRPGVQISDQEIETYFEKNLQPAEEKANPGRSVMLDDYRDRIEQVLTRQKVDQLLDAWLKETRARTAILYREEPFQ